MRTVSHVTQHRHSALENVLYFLVVLSNFHVRTAASLTRNGVGQLEPLYVEPSTLGDLQIGSFQGGADVVTNGIVQGPWSQAAPRVVTPNERQTRLWAVVANVATSGVPLMSLSATSAQPDVAVARLRWTTDSTHSKIMIGNVLKPLVVDVVYECHRSGSTAITMVYRFSDARVAPVEISFTKECGQRARAGLSLGTRGDRTDDVVRNGASLWSIATVLQRIIPPSQAYVDLFWALRASGGEDDTAAQSMAAPRVRVTPLSLHVNPAKELPIAESHRWQRRLQGLANRELSERRAGQWGLDDTQGVASNPASGKTQEPEVVRVHIIGALQDGGSLPAVSQIPNNVSPPGFRLNVQCLRMGAALVEVEVSPAPAYQPYRPTIISFVKQCGGVLSQGFDVSSRMLTAKFVEPDILRDGAPVDSTNEGFGGEVNNLAGTFSAYWRLADGSHGPPDASTVACEGNVVSAAISHSADPTPDQGTLSGRQDVKLQCVRSGTSWCTLKFGWQLYEGPSIKFRKQCGGIRKDVQIFSDLANTPAVFLQGQTDSVWGSEPQVTMPSEDDKTIFTIALDKMLAPGEKVLKMEPPRIHIFRPDVVEAWTGGELVDGGEVVKDSDGGDLEVQTKCKKTGTSRIEVTLPIKSIEPFKPLSFTFNKHCNVTPWHQMWMMALFPFLGLLCVAVCVTTVCMHDADKKFEMAGASRRGHREMRDVVGYGEA